MSRPSKAPTVYDVARLAEVSEATVSYVLGGRRSGKTRISEETRQRVLEAVEELGYVPNQSARSLSRQRTDRICLTLPRLGAPFHEALAHDLQRSADAHGYTMVIAVAGSAEQEEHIVDQLRRRLADGAILVYPNYTQEKDLSRLAQTGLALLVFSNHLLPNGFDLVRTPESEACEQAVDYLLAKGHRRFALLGNASLRDPQEQLQTYQRILRERGISADQCLIQSEIDTRQAAYHCTQDLLQRHEGPVAILTTADLAAISAIWAARDAGRRIPDEVAVIGNGNVPEGEITTPPLTTIGPAALDFTPIVDLLLSRLRGEAPLEGRVYHLPRKLILRGSA